MKKVYFILSTVFILLSCSQLRENHNLRCKVSTADKTSTDSTFVGIYACNMATRYNKNQSALLRFGNPIFAQTKDAPEISFDIIPGRYTIVVNRYGYDPFVKEFVIPDKETKLDVNVNLVPLSVESDINEVKIIGDFCNWKNPEAIPLVKENDYWILKRGIPENSEYVFLVDEIPIIGLMHHDWRVAENCGGFVNCNKTEEISFHPSLYSNKNIKSNAVISGFDRMDQYYDIVALKNNLLREYPMSSKKHRFNPQQSRQIYNTVMSKFDSLIQQYDEVYQPLLAKFRLSFLHFYHPFSLEATYLARHENKNYVQFLQKLLRSEWFEDYLNLYLHSLRMIDKNSYLYQTCGIGIQLADLDYFTNLYPEIRTKYKLNKDFFYDFITDMFIENPKEYFSASLIMVASNKYARRNEVGKTVKLATLLKEKYPNNENITKGFLDRILAIGSASAGDKAKDFSVNTLSGEKISLNALRGQFVFLEFWGSWCGGCKLEIPNVIKLSEAVTSNEVKIIGLMHDTKENAIEYLKTNRLPYPNAIVDDAILKAYGVSSMPLSFLIDPNGIIIGKDLQGEDLVTLVEKKIKNYKAIS